VAPYDRRVPLIDRADSLLIVIDAQGGFSGSSGEDGAAAECSRAVAGWLVGVAAALEVPILVTEEDAARNWPTDPSLRTACPPARPGSRSTSLGLPTSPTSSPR
jgi:hypothetical protein